MADKKVLIFRRNNQLLTALMHDKTLLEVHVNDENNASLVGNIYIGRVQNIVKNIEAAFVEISKGLVCYLPLSDFKKPYFTNRTSLDGVFPERPLTIGDELIVQVTRDALKTKQPAVTTNFSIPGEYLVLNHGETGIGISSKIKGQTREQLKSFLSENYDTSNSFQKYGIVLRTNAGALPEEEYSKIMLELEELTQIYNHMMTIASFRPAFTKLYSKQNYYFLDQIYQASYEEIVTDQKDVFDELELLKRKERVVGQIRYYNDDNLSLINLYGIESRLKEAIDTRIWLKSGGYLVIEPTEALTVIDVNTGKFEGKSASYEDTMLKINIEAANEVAHQLRLRNLSGIIIVDFINMELEANQGKLLSVMRQAVADDPIQTNVIGFTNLGLLEITRKKKNKPIKELIENPPR